MLSRQALSLRDVPDLRGERTEEEAEEGKRGERGCKEVEGMKAKTNNGLNHNFLADMDVI